MKTLEKAIIMALYPECKTWEEAVKEESDCNVVSSCCRSPELLLDKDLLENEKDKIRYYCKLCGTRCELEYEIFSISLPRVMQALKNIPDKNNDQMAFSNDDILLSLMMNWKLTDKNAKDLNLEDQSEETREALSKLFNV